MPGKKLDTKEAAELKELAYEKTLKYCPKNQVVAYVLVSTEMGKEIEVYNALLKCENVVETHPLFGEYDTIVKIRTHKYETVGETIVNHIRTIPGVIDTKTLTGIKF